MNAAMSLTRQLIRLIRSKQTTPADLHGAAMFTLDGIANAIAGRRTEQGRILAEWAGQAGTGDAGRHALLLGGLTHILEMDDLHRTSVVHPGCVTIPAAFALAGRTAAGGPQLLGAVLHGFEAVCRVGMALGPAHYRIWHSTATAGPFGSAMAAAHLLALSEDAAVDALGNAGTQSAGLWQFLETGAMSKHLHAGRAAEAGVVAAELAELGFSGPPAILEGTRGLFAGACPDARPGAVVEAPDDVWQLHQTSIKPWPSCRHTHPAVDAAIALTVGLAPERIDSIDVVTYQAAVDVCDNAEPTSVYEAKFSLQHCVAAALTRGGLDFDAFAGEARAALAPLSRRVHVAAGEPFAGAYPGAWGASVALTLEGGKILSVARNACKGDPEMPLSDGEMKEKARMLLAFGGLDEAAAEALIRDVLAMAKGGPVPALPRLRA